jgi:hypothetical protein
MVAPKSTITEDLTAQVDSVTDTFTVAGGPFIAGSLVVNMNGQDLQPGTIAGGEDTEELPGLTSFQICLVPQLGLDKIFVQYEIEDLGAGFPLVIASGREDC